MKKSRLILIATLGLMVLTAPSAQAGNEFTSANDHVLVPVPELEFTVAKFDVDHLMRGLPGNFSNTERALSQVRPGLDYDDGMVWLTLKYGGDGGLWKQIRNLRVKKRARSSWRLQPETRDHLPAAGYYRFEPVHSAG